MKKFRISLPKFRWPLSNPVQVTKLHQKLFGKNRKKLTWRRVGVVFLWGLGTVILGIVLLFAWFAKDLPTPGKIRALTSESSTRLFDRNMKPLYTISGEKKRILVESNEIPDVVRQATIALEDHNFYEHIGIDAKGLARAVIYGGSRGGGSTITQQFISNSLLDKKRTIVRKIKEAILAVELEALYDKDKILTMYLNEIPYGGNNYGIEAAARSFFGKSAMELTLSEAATLAALPQQPSTLSPYGPNQDKLLARRNFALDEMTDLGFITKEQAEAAKSEVPKFVAKRESITAPHFVIYVKDWLVTHFEEELGDKQLAEQKVESGGLTVITTLDLDKQRIAEDAIAKVRDTTLKRAGASNAALVSIDPKRGEVIAMVGSVDYFQEQFGAFNIATAKRQPGSSFKPIVYAAGFKEKYNPAYVLYDLKTDFGNYEPDNFDNRFRGPITIRQALGNSLNIPAVKMAGMVGLEKVLSTASDLGITTLTDKDRYGLSVALGGGEVRLLDMVTAYGVFANKGTLVPTTPILKITDSSEKELYNHDQPKDSREVLNPQAAYQVTSILADVEAKRPVFSGVMNVLTLRNRPVASKTGTTNAYRDAWTVGYTPQYATAVWAGNNDQTAMNRAGGSTAAAPIWDDFMERVHADLPVEQFERPAGIEEITVDRLSNKLPIEGSEPIKDIFAKWQIPTEKDDVHARVRVCKENGLLADASIPNELAEERTFSYVKSEKPENPNWENPVRAWAIANGYNNKPPTEKCSGSGDIKPTVTITSPADGANVSGVFAISASASAPSGVRQVEFLIDNTSIGIDQTVFYETSYNAANLSNGSHTIGAIVTSNNGATASTQVTVTVTNDTTPPDNVSGFTGSPGPGSGKVSLLWASNPPQSDFKLVRIYVYLDASNTLLRTVEVNKPNKSVVISGLTSLIAHRFVAKTVDEIGNENNTNNPYVVITPP
jgi:1A family penicillin-binding protein